MIPGVFGASAKTGKQPGPLRYAEKLLVSFGVLVRLRQCSVCRSVREIRKQFNKAALYRSSIKDSDRRGSDSTEDSRVAIPDRDEVVPRRTGVTRPTVWSVSSATGPRFVEDGDGSENDELHKFDIGDIMTLTVAAARARALGVTGDVSFCACDGELRTRCFCDGCDVSNGGGANDGSSFDDVAESGCTDVRGV